MFKNIEKLKIQLTASEIEKFEHYCKFFLDYNSKINLISNNDTKLLYEKHIYDSLSFNLFYTKYISAEKKTKLLDIGTGGGFPAVIIAIKYNNINVTALDSINKKINFIKCAAHEFGLTNLHPICKRAEDIQIQERESFDIVTSRAMAKLNIILEYAIPFLKTGGYFIAYKSIKTDEEIKEAHNALKTLNAKIIEKIEYSLPIQEENKRILIIIKKEKPTSKEYPRKNGIIKKSPL